MERWKCLWQTKQIQGDIPNNLLQSLAVCDNDSFPNIHTLLVIACTLLPARASEQGNVIGLVSVYICVYVVVYVVVIKKKL